MLFLTAAIWGLAFIAQRDGADYLGPFSFMAARNWISLAAMSPLSFLLYRKNLRQRDGAGRGREGIFALFAGGAACGFFLCMGGVAQQYALPMSTAAKAGFISALYVVWVPLLGLFLFRKKEGMRTWIGTGLSIVGLYLLCMKEGLRLGMGDLMLLLCAFLYAMQIICVEHFIRKTEGIYLALLQILASAFLSTILMFLLERPAASDFWAALPSLLYVGIFSGAAGYTMQITAQAYVDSTIASLILSLESVFSAVFGFLLLGQSLSGREILGCAFMLAAILFSQLPGIGTKEELPSAG